MRWYRLCVPTWVPQGRQERGGWGGLSRTTFAQAVTFELVLLHARAIIIIDTPIVCSVSNTVTITNIELRRRFS